MTDKNMRHMVRKLKFMLAVLLGFSAACSSVKNAPREKQEPQAADGESVDSTTYRPRVVAMYGVRPPQGVRQSQQRMERMMQDSIAPVLEQPADDMPDQSEPKR